MNNQSDNCSEWGDDVETLLLNISKNSVVLSKEHKKRFFYLQRLLRYFKIPSILLSSVNAVFSVSLSTFITQDRVSLLCSFISLITTIITSTEMYLGIEKSMIIELDSSKQYHLLSVEIVKVLSLSRCNRNIDSISFLDKCVSEYSKLFEASCLIEKSLKDSLLSITKDPLDFQPSSDELDLETPDLKLDNLN